MIRVSLGFQRHKMRYKKAISNMSFVDKRGKYQRLVPLSVGEDQLTLSFKIQWWIL